MTCAVEIHKWNLFGLRQQVGFHDYTTEILKEFVIGVALF